MSDVAAPDRRLHAFLLDRLLAWVLYAVGAWAAYRLLVEPGRIWAGIAVVAGTVLVVGGLTATALGTWGVTPGKALVGLRVLDAGDARPIGFGRAVLRTALLGAATVPTAGFGAAAGAWAPLADPSGRRRAWHDLRTRSVVVDVRRPTVVEEPEEEAAPQQVVNLTALRLVPASATPRQRTASRGEPPGPGRPPARWSVGFDTGERFEVRGLTLVGRRPEARRGEPVERLVTLPSDDMSVSKTHAQLQVVPGGALVVMDRGSTNGSVLVRAGVSRVLAGGRPATLRDGDRVRLGDREMSVVRLP